MLYIIKFKTLKIKMSSNYTYFFLIYSFTNRNKLATEKRSTFFFLEHFSKLQFFFYIFEIYMEDRKSAE